MEVRQEFLEKELSSVVETNKLLAMSMDALNSRIDNVNNTFKQVRNVCIGMAVVFIGQVVGLDKAIMFGLGLL